MKNKSIISEANDIQLAIEMIELGARLQLLENETKLSRERLLRLYKEVRGKSPPKGMLPFSTDWFMTWQPNIHASLFMAYYKFLGSHAGLSGLKLTVKSYRMYLAEVLRNELEPALTLTRAWTMVRFFEAGMLQLVSCTLCGGKFVLHAHEPAQHYVCGLCHMPARAGKLKKNRQVARARSTSQSAVLDVA